MQVAGVFVSDRCFLLKLGAVEELKSDQRLNLTIPVVVVRKVVTVHCGGDTENHFAQLTNCYGDTFYNLVPVRHKRDSIPAPITH